jgi:hypothetical protein
VFLKEDVIKLKIQYFFPIKNCILPGILGKVQSYVIYFNENKSYTRKQLYYPEILKIDSYILSQKVAIYLILG